MKTVQISIRVPYEVRREWKVLALNEDRTLTDVLVEAMKAWKEFKAQSADSPELTAIAEK